MMRSIRQVFAHRLMRRFAGAPAAMLLAGLVLAAPLGACDKPQEKDCKQAVANIRRIYGTQGITYGADPQAMVRSCRGSASRDSVRCFIAAKSMADLKACEGGTFSEMFGDQPKQPDGQPKQPDGQPKQPDGKPAPDTQPPAAVTPGTEPAAAVPGTAAPPQPAAPPPGQDQPAPAAPAGATPGPAADSQ